MNNCFNSLIKTDLLTRMAVSEMDGVFIRAFRYLHSNASDSLSNLEALLEDAIQSRYGPDVDLHSILNIVPPMGQENHINSSSNSSNNESLNATSEVMDECRTGSSSDNELELDLLKEDLMCIICKGMSQGARNRLLECAGCHCLYHQECHDPSVSQEEFENSPIWMCDTCTKIQQLEDGKNCKNMSPEKGEMISTSIVGSTTGSSTSPSPNSSSESPEKEFAEPVLGSTSKSSTAKLIPQTIIPIKNLLTSSSSRPIPNINIISADKRLQIMKKKAAKLQKRKLSR